MKSRPNEPTIQSGDFRSSGCDFALDNIAGFVLDALDRFERGLVEHHLRWCESCQAEAASFERVVAVIPFATEPGLEPGLRVKTALMDRVVSGEPVPVVSPPMHRQVPEAGAQPTTAPNPGWWRYASAALIAPLALTLLVMGVWANSLRTDLNERDSELASQIQFNQALAGGGQVALYSVEKSCPTCEGSGQLGMSESNDMGMVMGWNFDPDQRHDVWAVGRDGEKMKMCELKIDSAGAVMQMFTFPNAPTDLMDVYITDEHGVLTYVSHLADGNDATPGGDPESASPIT